ncbi:hypothetical protein PHYC_03131 [Phycisphaerales bacterium]|nr:hypothetical protein PHYC_03131 [Phycisphaerales bacterium]
MKTCPMCVAVAGCAAGLLAAGMFGVVAQPAANGPTSAPAAIQPDAKSNPDPATLQPLTFLAGAWRGVMDGDPVEEIWSSPAGDSIVGVFRWVSDDKLVMSELLNIKAEEGAAVLRLRHFGADFSPWKGECDGVAPLKATKVEKNKVVFTNATETGGVASCEYECPTPDTLKITVTFKPERQRDPLKFELKKGS